jgi:PAS domain S-box-containing protein
MKIFESIGREREQRRDPRLTAINFVADAVNRSLDLREIADNALDAILAVMHLDAAALYHWDTSLVGLRLFAHRGVSESFARQARTVTKGADLDVDKALEGEIRVAQDFRPTNRLFRGETARAGFRRCVLAPIRIRANVLAVLVLGVYREREFPRADIDLVEVFTNQIGNALAQAQLQSDLRASEEQYRTMVENSDDAIYITGADAVPRFSNSAFHRIFGFTTEELAARGILERIHPDDHIAYQTALARLLQGMPVHNMEYRFCRKDGEWIYLQCNASVYSREGDRVNELQFVVREVTEARQRQQQLLRRNRQLSALTLLAEVANSSLKIEEIARNTLEVALETTGMDGACIHLASNDRTKLNLYQHISLPADIVIQLREQDWGQGIFGMVAASGEPATIGNLTTKQKIGHLPLAQAGYRSVIVVPVRVRGAVLGTLGLISRHVIESTTEPADMVTAMGNQLGIALSNARLYEAQVQENEKLNALVDISSGSAQRLELSPLLGRILDRAAKLLRADAAYLVRYDAANDEATVVSATAEFTQLIGSRFPASQGLLGQIRGHRQGSIFSRQEVARLGYSPILKQADIRSLLFVPLVSRDQLIGGLGLTRWEGSSQEFAPSDLELLEAFANRAAVAIDNAQLFHDLAEKNRLLELLVEEAHHRIKNNLQMVSGLLQLQVAASPDELSSQHLRAAITRIHAIAQVHNLLSCDMPEKVNAQTIISTIAHGLVSHAISAAGKTDVHFEVERIWLSSEQAVALALIVNELISNSIEHGHPGDGGPVRVRVKCVQQAQQVKLSYWDNGGGLAEKDWRQLAGQGLNIIHQLAQVNLRGKLQLQNVDCGLNAELVFHVAVDDDSVEWMEEKVAVLSAQSHS